MKHTFDYPFPSSWTADDLAAAVPRPLSASFDSGTGTASAGRRAPFLVRATRQPLDRDLPTLFRVR